MHNALLIEDDRQSREYLKVLLASYPEIVIVGEASSVEEGVVAVNRHKPSLLFLDVELGARTGFDMLKELRTFQQQPAVIFTTGFDKYAIEAIRHSAFDYLLKPIDPAELDKVMLRLHTAGQESPGDRLEKLLARLEGPKKLLFHIRSGSLFIDPPDIFYCEADGNYTHMYLCGQRKEYITCQIGHVMDQLPLNGFLRLGRSIIINREKLSRIDRLKKQAVFEQGAELCVLQLGSRQLRELSDLLEG